MRTWRVVSSVDLTGAPEAVATIEGAAAFVSVPPDRRMVLECIRDADVYFASAEIQVDGEFLDAAPNLRLVATPSTGTDHLDREELLRRAIECIDISQEYELIESFTATSELAFGLLLGLARQLGPACEAAREGDWARLRFTGFQLSGKTIGILGLGRLGQITARIAQGFGMRVIGNDVREVSVSGVENVSFETLLEESDVLSIHVHLTPSTEGLVGRSELERMKPTAILLNTSRGRIVDEAALLEALLNRTIAGAGVDVIDGEWLSRDKLFRHPLIEYSRKHDNLLISPHIGGATTESVYGARIFVAQRIVNWIESCADEVSQSPE